MNAIERYLGRVVVGHTLLVLTVLLLILGFSEFMIQIGKVTEEYTLLKGSIYTLLKMPVFGYEIFPVALLIGTLIGLGGLANNGELTILRVTGWSIGRIFIGVMKSVFILWIIVALMGEWLAPKAETLAKKIRGEALQQNFSIGNSADFWLKEEGRYIHVGRVISDHVFHQVTIYTLENNELPSHLKAQKATFKEGQWHLENVFKQSLGWKESQLLDNANTVFLKLDYEKQEYYNIAVTLPIDPDLLQTLQIDTRYMGILDLYHYIDFLQANQLDAEPFKLAFWRKISTPFAIIGMIALVFPLIFGSQRQVSMGQRIFVGIMIGMSFHLLNQIFGNLSIIYQLPAMLGAFLPSIVLLVTAFFLMRRLR